MLGRIFKKKSTNEPPFANSHEQLKWLAQTSIELSHHRRENLVRSKAEYYQEKMGWDEEKAYRVADYVIEPWSPSWIKR